MKLLSSVFLLASSLTILAQTSPPAPISAAEAEAFGLRIEHEFRTNGPAFFVKSVDFRRLLELATADQPGKEEFKRGFREGALGSGFSGNLSKGMESFDSYKLLRTITTNERPQLVFRGLDAQGALNYHILELERTRTGRLRVVDMFVMITGEKLSETFRRLYLTAAAESDRSLLTRLTKGKGDWITHSGEVTKLSRLVRDGDYAAAIQLYDSLPESLRVEKTLLVMRLMAVSNTDDALYLATIEAFEKHHPNDPSLALVSIDGFVMKKQPRKAIAAIEKLDRFIGGDPYLLILLAAQYLEVKDPTKARELANKAIEREPSLPNSYDVLLTIALEKKDFTETARLLSLTEKNLEVDMLAAIQDEEDYAEFLASAPGKKWRADHQSK